jgi:poly(3-hydroxybutyrate) depolymerase
MFRLALFALVAWMAAVAPWAGQASAAEKAVAPVVARAPGAKASAGCGKRNPPSGALTIESQGGKQAYLVSLPPGYDPATPYPLGFAFHGHGRNHLECRDEDCPGFQSAVGAKAVVVYMKSIGKGWQSGPGGSANNVAFFTDVLAAMKRDYCIDERRVFVAGTSSGAGFVNQLGCKLGDQLLAIAPVHGRWPDRTGCKGYPAVINIHGIADKLISVTHGASARDFFAQRNGCGDASAAVADLDARILLARKAGRTEFGCVDYPGCARASVRWCVHSEGGYDDLNHGWPTLGGQAIWEFVAAQPVRGP